MKHTLKRSLHLQTIAVFASVAVFLLAIVTVFNFLQYNQQKATTIEHLVASVDAQINAILPGLIIPEQVNGIPLVLGRIQQSEGLKHVGIVTNRTQEDLLTAGGPCKSVASHIICDSLFSPTIKAYFPVIESGTNYGYLYKEIGVHSGMNSTTLAVAYGSILTLLLLFLGILWVITRTTRRLIPHAIDTMLNDLENGLDQPQQVTTASARRGEGKTAFRYEEFRQMQHNIEKILHSRHEAKIKASMADIVTSVVHDIRAPLAAIQTVIRSESNMPAEARRIIEGASGRLQSISSNLLNHARGAHGFPMTGAAKKIETIIIRSLSEQVDQILLEKKLLAPRGTNVTFEARVSPPADQVWSHLLPITQTQIERVLSNLLENSVQAMTRSGKIEVTCDAKDNVLTLSVSDTGKGISADVLPLLCKAGMTVGKEGGTGFGLYYAKKFAEDHDGRLSIKSKLGHGTTVTFSIVARSEAPSTFYKSTESVAYDAVILDDDIWVVEAWMQSAKSRGRSLLVVKPEDDFIKSVESLARSTPLYIDSDLGPQSAKRGEDYIPILREMGFQSIYIHSGLEKSFFAKFGNQIEVIPKGEPRWSLH